MMFAKPSLLATIATIAVVSATASVPLPKRVRAAFSSFKTLLSGSNAKPTEEMPTIEIAHEIVLANEEAVKAATPSTTDEAITLLTSSSNDSVFKNNTPVPLTTTESPVITPLTAIEPSVLTPITAIEPSVLTTLFSTPVAFTLEDMLIAMNKHRKTPIAYVPIPILPIEDPEEYTISSIGPCILSLLDLQYIMLSLEQVSAISSEAFILARCQMSGADFIVTFEIWESLHLLNKKAVDVLKIEMRRIFGVHIEEWSNPKISKRFLKI